MYRCPVLARLPRHQAVIMYVTSYCLGEPMENLRDEFVQAVRDDIKKCHEAGYHFTLWEKMISEKHPVDVAIHFIVSGQFQDGFKRLVRTVVKT